jgi:hypothetical protein
MEVTSKATDILVTERFTLTRLEPNYSSCGGRADGKQASNKRFIPEMRQTKKANLLT